MPATDCGGCKGIGNHKRHCRMNPDYTYARELADKAESLGDTIGSNNTGAANACYMAAALLRQQHEELREAQRRGTPGE